MRSTPAHTVVSGHTPSRDTVVAPEEVDRYTLTEGREGSLTSHTPIPETPLPCPETGVDG